ANFIFIRIKGLSSTELTHALMKKGIWVRDCSNFRGLDRQWIRIAVRKRKENMRLIKTLEKVLA
ncbi:MAG TPA: histidinol-phosphate aminotransferase, partial [Candidatus Omnitrophota bacterium]|nr:histidinol-phosphate aminotransferase [Candidatus Omnitrophota bacterium]